MSDKIKVVLYVDGGAVQSVFASLPDSEIAVEVVDADDLEAEGKSNAEIDELLIEATTFLYPIW